MNIIHSLASVGITSAFTLALVSSPMVSAISLTLNLNGAAPNVYTTSADSSTITIPSTIVDFNDSSNNSLTIKSWNTCPDGTGTTYHKGDTLTTSTTLYAQWSNGLHISDTISGCGATTDPDEPEETYGSLDDLNNITITVNGEELTTFDPQDLDGVYEVDNTSTIVLKSTGLDAWTITRSNPTSSSLVFTLTSKDKDGNELKAVYTFKAKSSSADDNKGDTKDDDDDSKDDGTKDDSDNDNGNDDNNTNDTTGKVDDNNSSNNNSSGGNANGSSSSNGSSSNSSSSSSTSTSTGSPSAGYANLPSKLTMPVSFILAGILAIVAVLKLTKKEANSSKKTIPPVRHRRTTSLYEREVLSLPLGGEGGRRSLTDEVSTIIPPLAGKGRQMSGSSSVGISSLKSAGRHFFTGRARYAVLSLAILSLVTGTFFLAKTISNAADSTNIYAGYEGYFTVGETIASGQTTWWKDGTKQSGQSNRNGKWHWFELDSGNIMALNKEVYIDNDHNNGDDGKWVRYDANGDMVYGEYTDGTDWWHYDDATGAMTYGWYTLAANEQTTYERKVYYDKGSGKMLKNVTTTDPDGGDFAAIYDFDSVDGNATWHLPVSGDGYVTEGSATGSDTVPTLVGDRRQRVLIAALSKIGGPYQSGKIPYGFVCDGLTSWAYRVGTGEYNLGAYGSDWNWYDFDATYQWAIIKERHGIKSSDVSDLSQYRAGDLIYFDHGDRTIDNGRGSDIETPGYHAAIYYHDGLMIHAGSNSATGNGVNIHSITDYVTNGVYNTFEGGGSPYIAETSKVDIHK